VPLRVTLNTGASAALAADRSGPAIAPAAALEPAALEAALEAAGAAALPALKLDD
jgi:hypothetical protein